MKSYILVKCKKCGSEIEKVRVSPKGHLCFNCKKKRTKERYIKRYQQFITKNRVASN